MTDHVKIYGVTPRIQYTADGTLTTYEFPFAIFSSSDINIYFDDTLQDDSTYTVEGAQSSDGGSVTFETAPTAGTTITIIRNLSIERTTDFQEGGALRADTLNQELDYQIACQQQIAENLNRSMVLPPYAINSDLDLTLPTPSAGKAIVWNSSGTNLENSAVAVNELESTLNDYKTAAQAAASTATSKASIATEQAQTAITKAGEATSTLNKLNGTRTNCITEIPQNIKLELSSGTLTLKAESKIYVPDGSGVFTVVTVPEDITTTASDNGERIVFANPTGTSISSIASSSVTSGTTPPAGSGMFYNTSTNMVNYYSSGTIGGQRAFPIAKITVSSGAISSIDQVFNGFGYIGSTVFVLPGVKGLIPNGKENDGTLVNTPFAITEVKTASISGNNLDHTLRLSDLGIVVGTLEYNQDSNYNYAGNSIRNSAIAGSISYTSNLITQLKVKQAFPTMDYYDLHKLESDIIPNYSAGVSISSGSTAPSNGYIFAMASGNRTATLKINGVTVFDSSVNSNYGAVDNSFIPIRKGSTMTITGSFTHTFFPYLGG